MNCRLSFVSKKPPNQPLTFRSLKCEGGGTRRWSSEASKGLKISLWGAFLFRPFQTKCFKFITLLARIPNFLGGGHEKEFPQGADTKPLGDCCALSESLLSLNPYQNYRRRNPSLIQTGKRQHGFFIPVVNRLTFRRGGDVYEKKHL